MKAMMRTGIQNFNLLRVIIQQVLACSQLHFIPLFPACQLKTLKESLTVIQHQQWLFLFWKHWSYFHPHHHIIQGQITSSTLPSSYPGWHLPNSFTLGRKGKTSRIPIKPYNHNRGKYPKCNNNNSWYPKFEGRFERPEGSHLRLHENNKRDCRLCQSDLQLFFPASVHIIQTLVCWLGTGMNTLLPLSPTAQEWQRKEGKGWSRHNTKKEKVEKVTQKTSKISKTSSSSSKDGLLVFCILSLFWPLFWSNLWQYLRPTHQHFYHGKPVPDDANSQRIIHLLWCSWINSQ